MDLNGPTAAPANLEEANGRRVHEREITAQRRIYVRRVLPAVVVFILLIAVALAVLPGLSGQGQIPLPNEVTVAAPSVPAPEPSDSGTRTAEATATAAAPAGPPAAPPQRLVYPGAGIDVVVNPLQPTEEDKARQTIVPPPTMDGYWLVPYGMPGAGSNNTTYIAGHSWQDREAPFNRLSTNAAPGDLLSLTTQAGELVYQVDSVTTYVKSGLKDSPIWDVVPNRLVLISCYTDDLWGTNVVLVASPIY